MAAARPSPELAPVMTTVGFCVAGGPTADPAAAPAAGGASIVAAAAVRTAARCGTAAVPSAGEAKVSGGVGRAVRGAARGADVAIDGRAADGLAKQRAAGSWQRTFICADAQYNMNAWAQGAGVGPSSVGSSNTRRETHNWGLSSVPCLKWYVQQKRFESYRSLTVSDKSVKGMEAV